ncbi:gluconate 2-dehydrogenase subunit 3 family protein [candidate division KSB1 bacterium]|nr:gluconate 2-dehydrogenase subunit 3 family protein [candidate division KSB1 bacterium]
MPSSRRQFLKQAASGFAGTVLLGACAATPKSRWRFFTREEASLVDLITEQIIPTDDTPGGIEAGCLNFIDKQLVGAYRRHQNEYRQGLLGLQNSSRGKFGKTFQELDWPEQTDVLDAIEAGDVEAADWSGVSPQRFFQLIRDHTMQGFYGSPRHGGNKNYLSYRMLELDVPHIIGQNRYTQGLDKPNGWIN